MQQAIDFSVNSPDPDPQALYVHMYGRAALEQFSRMKPGAPFGEMHIAPEGSVPQATNAESEPDRREVATTN